MYVHVHIHCVYMYNLPESDSWERKAEPNSLGSSGGEGEKEGSAGKGEREKGSAGRGESEDMSPLHPTYNAIQFVHSFVLSTITIIIYFSIHTHNYSALWSCSSTTKYYT